ncbi:hypothetical protein APA_2383 [Pseudanabaena sp. lw0831]|nr:hypothetical protein APA_2383 [Pseudanabaena sp. lw0831]
MGITPTKVHKKCLRREGLEIASVCSFVLSTAKKIRNGIMSFLVLSLTHPNLNKAQKA